MLSRRSALASGGALALAGAFALNDAIARGAKRATPASGFVTVRDEEFRIDGKRYRYIGANMWYAAYLGADAAYGDRARLKRELAATADLGIDNVRLLGSSEESPLKGAIGPTFSDRNGNYNETLLKGLDFTLAEMGRLGMKGVIYLNNFWEWSGGMMAYLNWTNGGHYINMGDPAYPWPAYPDFVGGFYANRPAVKLYHDYIRAVVTRTNSITGKRYVDDPAIMAWQLANEPRPGESAAVGTRVLPSYLAWIRETATLIKTLDPSHLLSIGAEGLIGCLGSEACVTAAVSAPGVDYMTIHIWPQNFGWIDPADLAGTWQKGADNTRDYIAKHVAFATKVGKPLVIEEFGFPRDSASYEPGTPTTYRDRFYALILDAVAANAAAGGPLAGSNFWAWGGGGRAAHLDHLFRPGDTSYLGDPPHEPQGWYSVFAEDRGTRKVIADHARALRGLASRAA